MDLQSYKVNECSVLLYMMEAGMEATTSLSNGKLYHTLVVEKKATGVTGIEGKNDSLQWFKMHSKAMF